jgi:ribonuclease HI
MDWTESHSQVDIVKESP